ncbi:replication protein E1 [Deltapapillomavirus 3]|uniref:E1 n=1 Tax=Deltapapillomavirus 3 TaxID=56144 RepID=UPI0000161E5B|nr:replication protein E1 [Deltapapillomavirus 3]
MSDEPGSSGIGKGSEFILLEAECDSSDSEADSQVDSDAGHDLEDFVDNATVFQGNHRELFQIQEKEAGDKAIQKLKRKLALSPSSDASPEIDQLSPGLAAITLQPRRNPLVKRRLFDNIGPKAQDEANSPSQVSLQVHGKENGRSQEDSPHGSLQTDHSVSEQKDSQRMVLDILKSKNSAACKLKLFKTIFACSYSDLTRVFQSNKTTNLQWVIAAYGPSETMFEASFELLKKACSYLLSVRRSHETGTVALFLACFNNAKSRDTVRKLFASILNVHPEQLLMQPPKIRGVCAALFWFRLTFSPATLTYGTLPQWIRTQTIAAEYTDQALKFDFGTMVQWAYDNSYCEESKIAYEYAMLANCDSNAKAFLASNNQAKMVKDCATMVRHYKRAEVQAMSISEYIKRRCEQAPEGGSWLPIMNLFKFQGIEPIRFVNSMRQWLRGVPKKNCICIVGPPNSGKSLLCNSLISFLGGRVLTFAMHKSHFWLAPLSEARVALIDDATYACWKYFDTYLRNALDGYPICIDRKHKTAVQMKAPPLLVTSNIDVHADEKLYYLHSRIVSFYFKETCTTANGEPMFSITNADWKIFFERLWGRLELSDQEEEGEEDVSQRPFTCSARAADAAD